MPGKRITNPAGAYGATASYDRTEMTLRSSAAITARKVVAIGTDSRVATAATNGTASLAIGVALNTVTAANQNVQVVTHGRVTSVPVDGAVAAGDVLKRSVTTAGSLAATATPATGESFAIALAASASNTATVWVLK